jgi:IS5 family transposase
MFKDLLLGYWFNLSNKDLSEAIADRPSFQRFLGLPFSDSITDDTILCRFRQKLLEIGLLGELFRFWTFNLKTLTSPA